jgi:hypothetical protein
MATGEYAAERTSSREPPSLENGEVVRSCLSNWAHWRRQQREVAEAAEAWVAQLQSAGFFWKAVGAQVPRLLSQQFEAVAQLSQALAQSPPSGTSQEYQQWCRDAQLIRDLWPPRDSSGWEVLLVQLPQQGSHVVTAIIAQTLAAGLQSSRLPRAVTSELAPLIQHDLQWCRGIQLPPASKYSLCAADYLIPCQDLSGWNQVEDLCAAIVRRLDQLRGTISRLPPTTGDRPASGEFESARCRILEAAQELSDLAQSAREGWPIQAPVLRQKCDAVFSQVAQLRSSAAYHIPADDEDLANLSDRLRILGDELLRTDQPLEPASVEATAASDREAPTDPERQTALALDPCREIACLAQDLEHEADAPAQQLARRLLELSTTWDESGESHSSPSAHRDANRRLLGCLTYLDDLFAASGRKPIWVTASRDRLRRILSDAGTYVLLDSQLIGRDLATCEDQAQAVGFANAKSVEPGMVALVQQPGYAVRLDDGTLRVLRRARVFLAK